MSIRTFLQDRARACRAARSGRLALIVGAALVAGLAADWLRSEERLLFPRPLPVFRTVPPR